jgi:predicted acylesterase/phospholipase RssA
MKHTKSALLLTGSGGNLSQEIAIIDQLIQKNRIQPNPKHTLIIASGTSSINAVAINACFRKETPCSWDNYYKKLFLETLSSDEIFMKVHPVQWSTHAMRNKIGMLLRMAGFSKLSDLPFYTSILISSTNRTKTVWLKSTSEKHENGDLTDILMASSAIPVLFPPQIINSVFDLPLKIKDGTYLEGAKNGLFFNFRKQLKKIIDENYSIDELFIVSPQRFIDPSMSIKHNLSGMTFEERETFDNYLNQISLNEFLNFLKELNAANYKHKIAQKIFVTLPETGKIFNLIDFDNQSSKYDTIYNWLEENPDKLSVELNQFCENISFNPHPSLV